MGKKHTFQAEIKNAGGGGAFVEVPFDVQAAFGSKRPKVRALIEGVSYRGSLVRMGSDCHILGILKDIRERTGKSFGDTIKVTVEADVEPRRVGLPPGFAAALRKEKAAQAYFNSLSYSHQREYAGYITEAKREETRAKRIAKTVELLKQGRSKNRPG
jgi:hypothetical protein